VENGQSINLIKSQMLVPPSTPPNQGGAPFVNSQLTEISFCALLGHLKMAFSVPTIARSPTNVYCLNDDFTCL